MLIWSVLYIAVLVVSYGVSDTIVLEMPWFTTETAAAILLLWENHISSWNLREACLFQPQYFKLITSNRGSQLKINIATSYPSVTDQWNEINFISESNLLEIHNIVTSA